MRRLSHIGMLAAVLLGVFFPANAAPLLIPNEFSELNVTPFVDLLPDPSGELSIEDITGEYADKFEAHLEETVQQGITDKPLWVRVWLRNGSDSTTHVLTVENPRLRDVRLYRPGSEGGWDVLSSGTDYPFYSRPILQPSPSFLVNIRPDDEQVWYLRVHNTGSLRFKVRLFRPIPFHQHVMHQTAYTFLLVGSFFAMTFYNFFIFLGLRERGYLYLSMLIGMFLLCQMSLSGAAHMYLWPNAPWWSNHSITFLVMVAVSVAFVFSNEVNNAYQYAPVLARINLVAAGVALLVALISLTDWMPKYTLSHGLGAIMPVMTMLVAVRSWYSGYHPAGYFILAWSLGVIGSVLLALLGPGWIPSNLVTEHLAELGFLLAIFLWSFTLSDRVVEKEEQQRQVLEQRVTERTAELSEALSEVQTLEGLLPICSGCKKIREDTGYWSEVEDYIRRHTRAGFSHGLCPDCAIRLYPEYFKADKQKPKPD